MINQKINTTIAMLAVLAVGVGASYIIISFANKVESSLAAGAHTEIVKKNPR